VSARCERSRMSWVPPATGKGALALAVASLAAAAVALPGAAQSPRACAGGASAGNPGATGTVAATA